MFLYFFLISFQLAHLFFCCLEPRQILSVFDPFYWMFFVFLVGHVKRCVKLNTKIARFPVKHVKLLVFIKIRIKICLTKALNYFIKVRY